MAFTPKVLGQSNPGASLADLYTVPSTTNTVVSTIMVANTTASASTYRIAILPSGGSIGTEHYIAYDVAITANNSVSITSGFTLATGDKIKVYGGASGVVFSAFGSELT
jgi:hypothetical protein